MDFKKFDTRVTVDNSGINEFVGLCKSRESFSREDVERLLASSSYNKLIELGGPNILMDSKDLWSDTFYSALNGNTPMDKDKTHDNMWPERIREHVLWACSNIDKIELFNSRIVSEISKGTFIELAKMYAPDDIDMENFVVNLVIFANNCFGIDKDMIIDIVFLGKYSDENITRILAHELHHMLRHQVEVKYDVAEKYRGISQALFWFETEGIANLCNFEVTSELYEKFGYAEKGRINEILENMNSYLSELNNLMLEVLNDHENSKRVTSFLRKNIAFHPISFYMATKIKEILGIEKLRECVGDQLKFFKYYNHAAKSINKPEEIYLFNDEVLRRLDEIFS